MLWPLGYIGRKSKKVEGTSFITSTFYIAKYFEDGMMDLLA